ncbi:MAG: hypothetical protein KAT33_02880 [Bacteroidales bacterium]|jgi:hypothetical protein|nr:hypothetical protein [Bacteroidales bacterium]MCK4638342.1 hypothetical protein [Bacteroidales bacterium]
MNRQQFVNFIKSPNEINAQSINSFEQVTKDFPYCQTAKILYVLNLFKEKSIKYDNQLKIAAAYASNRKILKKLIDNINFTEEKIELPDEYTPETAKQEKEKADKAVSDLKDIKTDPFKEEEQELSKTDELKKIIEKRLKEIKDEKQKNKAKSDQTHHTVETILNKKTTVSDKNLKSKSELIDKFIKGEPSITRIKPGFYNPVDSAHQSIVDEENIVSETLAKIYYDQGIYYKAIKIYEKLSLKFPEKSSIFAAQIKKIQELK